MTDAPDAPQQGGFLRLRKVLELFPVSRSTWWNGIAQGIYPRGVKISKRCTAWRYSDIKELIEKQGEAR